MEGDPITVEVWSDVACPWCYIGKRRLEGALQTIDDEVDLRFRSFQLDPSMPSDFEGSAAEYLARYKGIPYEQARQMQRQVSRIAAEVDLAYDFDTLKPANTSKAHRLLQYSFLQNRQTELKEALMRAHFVEGRHIGQDEVLVDIADRVGLDADEARSALLDPSHERAVDEDLQLGARIGIRGVPFFLFDRRLAVSGAQREEVFVAALDRARGERISPG